MINIIEADLNLSAHTKAIVDLMDIYALDPSGGGQGLSEYAKKNLPTQLALRKTVHAIIAFVDDEPAGLAICIEGFSTFACKPLLNIHDLIVASSYRKRGLSQMLLQKAEDIALSLDCCKLTLEVLEKNYVARLAYKKFGFIGYELNPEMGNALFLEKKLEYNL